VLVKALEEALKSAARKKYGPKIDIEVQYGEETGELEVFQFKEVAEVVEDPMLQISIEEGRKLDAECEVGDSLGTKMDTATFGRIAAQSAKQVIIQKLKDAEKDAVYTSFIERRGEIINGIVQRIDRGDIIVNLGQTEGVLPVREQVPKESYRRGDRIRAMILEVLHESRGPQVVLSRTHPSFLITLFRTEVPEISEGIVSIMGASPRTRGARQDRCRLQQFRHRPGRRLRRHEGQPRAERRPGAARRKIDIIPGTWIPPSSCAIRWPRRDLAGDHRRGQQIDGGHRPGRVPFDRHRQERAECPAGLQVDGMAPGREKREHLQPDHAERLQLAHGASRRGHQPGGCALREGYYSAEEIGKASVEDLLQIRGIDETLAGRLIEAAKTAAEQAATADTVENPPAGEPDEAREAEGPAEAAAEAEGEAGR